MNYVKGIYLKKTKFEQNPWQVNVDKKHFGKRIRERFKTKALAETATQEALRVYLYELRSRTRSRAEMVKAYGISQRRFDTAANTAKREGYMVGDAKGKDNRRITQHGRQKLQEMIDRDGEPEASI